MKKRLVCLILALSLFLVIPATVCAVNVRNAFDIIVTKNCWLYDSNSKIYLPILELDVTNTQSSSAPKIVIKAVFYNDSQKVVLDDYTDYLISSSDIPLRSGYSKSTMVYSTTGYSLQSSQKMSDLPNITVELYVNDEFYGVIGINNVNSLGGSGAERTFATYDDFDAAKAAEAKIEAEKAAEEAKKAAEEAKIEAEKKASADAAKDLILLKMYSLAKDEANKQISDSSKWKIDSSMYKFKLDETNTKFACVMKVVLRSTTGGKNDSFYLGYAGHLDGEKVVIENTEKLRKGNEDFYVYDHSKW